MNKTTAVFLSLTLATAVGIACICVPSPASPEPLLEEPTEAPTEAPTTMPTGAPTEAPTAAPTEKPTPEGPPRDEVPESPVDETTWHYCDGAQVYDLSFSDTKAGWAMVDCYHEVGIRTTNTEYL